MRSGARMRPPLTLTLSRHELDRFSPLLQRGAALHVIVGRSVYGFLTEDLGLEARYVRERITTVFLDGQVVDVLEEARLQPGSSLALSAAMPGLVGATLRRSGPYAAMRAEITRPANGASTGGPLATSIIRVKLFNLLVKEIGPVLLARGILLDRHEAMEILGGRSVVAERPPGDDAVEVRVRFA